MMNSILRELFSEDNGNLSTMRILVSFIVFVIMFNYTYFCLSSGTLASFSWSDLMVILGPLMMKSYQKGKEEDNNE